MFYRWIPGFLIMALILPAALNAQDTEPKPTMFDSQPSVSDALIVEPIGEVEPLRDGEPQPQADNANQTQPTASLVAPTQGPMVWPSASIVPMQAIPMPTLESPRWTNTWPPAVDGCASAIHSDAFTAPPCHAPCVPASCCCCPKPPCLLRGIFARRR